MLIISSNFAQGFVAIVLHVDGDVRAIGNANPSLDDEHLLHELHLVIHLGIFAVRCYFKAANTPPQRNALPYWLVRVLSDLCPTMMPAR